MEERQKIFHSSIQKKKGDRIDEKGAIECKTYEEFAIYWATVAGSAETRLSSGRRKGWRKWSKRYQSFAKGVDGFMKDFSPIVEIIKGVYPPFGGIAIGTISALFVVGPEPMPRSTTPEELISTHYRLHNTRKPWKDIFQQQLLE